MKQHAILSPSGASRWLACTPSARLEERFPYRVGTAADEGTLAHSLCELILKKNLKLVNRTTYAKELAKIQSHNLYEHVMFEYCENYAVFVQEQLSEAKKHTSDALLFLEQKLDLTDFIPEGFGTGDAVIIANGVMEIIDFKYGKGVPVFAPENKQMMLYGLGALKGYDFIYDIHTVRMTIFQPRIDNVSTWEIEAAELMAWAETDLKVKAKQAFDGEGEYQPGSHCMFCKAKAVCKANADYHLEAAKYDFKQSPLLTDDEVSDILNRADAFKKWLTAVEDHALNEAINSNKNWPGYKLVEGRSNRTYSDPVAVANKLLKEGYSEDVIYNKSILGITAMEKELGKAEFAEKLSDLIIKPPGKPTLVPATDKRPAWNSTETAKADFAEVQ